jgi:hypothetical protein
MDTKKGTILTSFVTDLHWGGAPLSAFLFLIASYTTSQFQPPINAPQLKAHFSFRGFQLDSSQLSPKSLFRKEGFKEIPSPRFY